MNGLVSPPNNGPKNNVLKNNVPSNNGPKNNGANLPKNNGANIPKNNGENAPKNNSVTAPLFNIPKNNTIPMINSFVTAANNTVKNVGNTVKNVSNTALNAVSVPVTTSINAVNDSIKAIPSGGPSVGLIISITILVLIIGLVVTFSKKITEAIHSFMNSITSSSNSAVKGVGDIMKDAEKELGQAVDDIESAIPQSANVNKFIPTKKQVFNVAENKYTYSDAEPLCRALGAELATYEQVKDAWNHGADWCNYGWIKGQGAVYPTQQASWDKLQRGTDDERMQCGQVGVNGGYYDNPDLRFGVNCYGSKPPESEHDMKRMLEGNDQALTPEAITEKKKELKFKSESDRIGVNPFHDKMWSE